jgi:hypothetical protein
MRGIGRDDFYAAVRILDLRRVGIGRHPTSGHWPSPNQWALAVTQPVGIGRHPTSVAQRLPNSRMFSSWPYGLCAQNQPPYQFGTVFSEKDAIYLDAHGGYVLHTSQVGADRKRHWQ